MHLLYMWLGLVGLTSSSDCLNVWAGGSERHRKDFWEKT